MTKWAGSDHAIKRVGERFGVKEGALNWINQRMEKATYVTNAPDAEGRMRRVFISGNAVIHASLTENTIYTVIPAQKRTEWSGTLRKLAEKEIRRFNAAAVAQEREVITRKIALEIELVDVKAALLKARIPAKSNAIMTKFNEISAQISDAERELAEIRRSVVRMAESYAAVM